MYRKPAVDDFFGREAFLTVSGQLNVEAYCLALTKVSTFGPTFRAENSNTSRHLAEFWMVEPEMAFFELEDNMDLAEAFLKRIFRDVLERCPEDMKFFAERIDPTAISPSKVEIAVGSIRSAKNFMSSGQRSSTSRKMRFRNASARSMLSSSSKNAISGSTIQNSAKWRDVLEFSARNVGPN